MAKHEVFMPDGTPMCPEFSKPNCKPQVRSCSNEKIYECCERIAGHYPAGKWVDSVLNAAHSHLIGGKRPSGLPF